MNTYIVTTSVHDENDVQVIRTKTVIAPDELTAMAQCTGEIIDIEIWSDEGEDIGHCPHANIPIDDTKDRPFKTEDF